MNKKRKIRLLLGGILTLALVVTCGVVYQSGSKSTANEKELVMENEEDSVDQAIKTEEREDSEEETADANTSNVEGSRDVEEETTQEKEGTDQTEASQDQGENTQETETGETEENQEGTAQDSETASAQITEQVETAMAPDLNFTESSLMEWPVSGQVVLDYNMDNTVYFPTLNVYKTSPAIAISAEVGTPVMAVANGQILSITENEETGTTVTVDMGNGYQAIYGQLKDVPFQAEEYVSAGAVLGYINEPTKYYTKEGANLYFALQKDGTPLDPLQYLP